jgi:hypothetical protein
MISRVGANAQRGVTLGDLTLARLAALGESCEVPSPVLSLHDREDHR